MTYQYRFPDSPFPEQREWETISFKADMDLPEVAEVAITETFDLEDFRSGMLEGTNTVELREKYGVEVFTFEVTVTLAFDVKQTDVREEIGGEDE